MWLVRVQCETQFNYKLQIFWRKICTTRNSKKKKKKPFIPVSMLLIIREPGALTRFNSYSHLKRGQNPRIQGSKLISNYTTATTWINSNSKPRDKYRWAQRRTRAMRSSLATRHGRDKNGQVRGGEILNVRHFPLGEHHIL